MNDDERLTRIWLEVSDIQYGAQDPDACTVQLKGDRARREPVWWPVAGGALGSGTTSLDIYKQVLSEMDKKRVALAALTWDDTKKRLHCDAFRFQSADLGSRSV